MRDPARIPRILEALRVEWERMPDMRLGQLLINAMPPYAKTWDDHPGQTLCLTEDEQLVREVQEFTAQFWANRREK